MALLSLSLSQKIAKKIDVGSQSSIPEVYVPTSKQLLPKHMSSSLFSSTFKYCDVYLPLAAGRSSFCSKIGKSAIHVWRFLSLSAI